LLPTFLCHTDLLTFDKLESGILELHPESVSALSFVDSTVGMFKSQAREKEIDLRLVLPGRPITGVCGDRQITGVCGDRQITGVCDGLPLVESDRLTCDRFKLEQVRGW
jgi:signal transduction histidine kinase